MSCLVLYAPLAGRTLPAGEGGCAAGWLPPSAVDVLVEIGNLVRSNRKKLHSSNELCILGQRHAFRVFAAFNKELVEWMDGWW
jgi:hypothetical protein